MKAMSVSRVVLLGCLICTPAIACAQDQPRSDSSAPTSHWQDYFRHLAGEYRMTAGENDEQLTLLDKPVLKWSQPVRGGDDGAVYLWLDRGRPAAVGTFFIWPDKDGRFGVSHELHRLTARKLAGQWRSQVRWRPAKDAVSWQLMPDAEAPDANATRRAIQVRQIARRFAASSINRQDERSELRLQPRPFFQYAGGADDDWLGGALFSLVHGTDTELILWLEARPGKDGAKWHFAFARMSDLRLTVTLDGKEVWSADVAKYNQYDGPYLCTAPEFLRQPPSDESDATPK
jgi:hypothetical protein